MLKVLKVLTANQRKIIISKSSHVLVHLQAHPLRSEDEGGAALEYCEGYMVLIRERVNSFDSQIYANARPSCGQSLHCFTARHGASGMGASLVQGWTRGLVEAGLSRRQRRRHHALGAHQTTA